MKTPILETERLILRPLALSDCEAIFNGWTSDPEVSRFMRWNTHENIEVTRGWIRREEELVEDDSVYNFGFVLKETGELIGSGGLVFVEERGMYELGYNLMKKYWGKGLTTEAAQRIVDFAANDLEQKTLFCCHAKDNPASGRVMEKIGFKYIGDSVYYSWDKTRKFDSRDHILEL